MAYSSLGSYRNRHYTIDNPISLRREVREHDSDKLVAFISKEIVDAMQDDITLKLEIIRSSGMLTINPWSFDFKEFE
tara:strand:+ start:619 stop:849 length:231 start_codon:yes stop_codon:yes gene_type:complete